MNIEERIKNHLQQLAPHVAHRETATLLTLCLGELKLAKAEIKSNQERMKKMEFIIDNGLGEEDFET